MLYTMNKEFGQMRRREEDTPCVIKEHYKTVREVSVYVLVLTKDKELWMHWCRPVMPAFGKQK